MSPLVALLRTRWLRAAILSTVISALLAVYSLPVNAETPGIGVSKPTATVSEGGTTDWFNVWLGTQPATSVTLSVVNSATTQLTATPLYLTFTGSNWNTPQAVTLTATNDTADDGDTTATITLSVLDGASDDAYDTVADAAVTVSVSDNNTCGLTIVESNGSTGVTEAATTDTFTVALGAQPTSNVVVSVTSGDAGEATVSTAQLTFTNANWTTAQTLTVTGVDDDFDRDDATTLTLAVDDGSSDDTFDAVAEQNVAVT